MFGQVSEVHVEDSISRVDFSVVYLVVHNHDGELGLMD